MKPVKKVMRDAKFNVAKNAPTILTVVGCVSIISTAILAAKATPKAVEHIKEAEEKKGDKLSVIEIIKACGVDYIPAVASAGIGVAACISSNRLSNKRCIESAAAALTAEGMLHAYQQKVAEQIGEKKERAIRDDIAAEKYKEAQKDAKPETVYIMGSDKPRWVLSDMPNNFFYKSKNEIDAAINRLDAAMNGGEMYFSYNEFLYEVCGLPGIPGGDLKGWNVWNHGLFADNVYFTSTVDPNDGVPTGIISFYSMPDTGFNTNA